MLDCNQYIISDDKNGELVLFDAGNGQSLKGLIEGMKNIELDYQAITKVYLTHEHVDHVIGIYPLMELLKKNPPKLYAFTETAKIIKEGNESKIFPGNLGINASMFGVNIKPLDVIELKNNEVFNIGSNFTFKVYHTPGHSEGSICYYEPNKKILIPGDLVFTGGSFGRYDFPGGSLKKLIESIKFTTTLDVHYLLPGHMGISDNGTRSIQESFRMIQSIGRYF
jgi:glyoxylase-like metal-dependent hydrolase (beta-lactamase superfamily II)